MVVGAAAILALTTACGQGSGASSVGSQNVGATAPAGGYGSVGAGTGTGASASPSNGYGADGQQGSATQTSPAGQLNVASNAELGKVLTDSAGLTLYRFDEDTREHVLRLVEPVADHKHVKVHRAND